MKMNKIRKRILSVVFALAIIVTSIGVYITDSIPMSQVNAASNPEYVAEIAPGGEDNYVRKNVPYTDGATYVFSCNYYVADETTAHLTACLDSGVKWGVKSANTGTGVNGKVGTLTFTHTATTSDGWLAFRFINYGTTDSFYVWNIKLTINGATNSNFRNPDFTEGSGSWIGWQLPKYFKDNVSADAWSRNISDADTSGLAADYTGHIIHKYDLNVLPFLPDYTLEPNCDWDNDAKTLTFSDEEAFDLSTITDYHLYKEGYAFVGWKNSAGEYLTTEQVTQPTTYAKGEVLTAVYEECSREANGDFAIRGEEMRTDDMGLRFIVEISNTLRDTLEVTEYGTLVLPSDVLDNDTNGWSINVIEPNDYDIESISATGWSDLTYNGSYTYNGKTYAPEIVKAKNIYQTLGDRVYYTLCITNITEAKYDRQYTVKGYAKYTDNNGVERFLYTDYASTNPYIVCGDMIDAETVTDTTVIDKLNNVVNTVNTKYQTARASMEEGKITLDNDTLPTNVVFDSTKLGAGENFYKLTNGLRVRELVIDTADGVEGNDVEITHLSDMHYNYFNALDGAQPTDRLLVTMNNRTWGAKGAHTTQGRKLLEYARTSDATIISGDLMDYLSYGTIELMKREVWDRYPNTLISIGNHEFSQKTDNDLADTLSPEVRWNWISKVWAKKHDYNYTSKVVNEKVMIVQLNNGDNTFYEEQVTKLSADLATAREKGYVVLLFMHEPLVTGNAADTAVTAILTGDLTKYDFATGKEWSNVYPGKNEATANMFELIKTNADVIQGVFNGHIHTSFYTEIQATTKDGTPKAIPQYTVHASAFNSGYAMKIIVK